MRLGIGLPTTIPGAGAGLIVPWARSAEAAGFASLGVHDRPAFESVDPLAALAAAAAVTSSIRLAALVVIAPLRTPAILARQAAAIHAISSGRLTLGLGLGPRRDDYELAGVAFESRRRLLEESLRAVRPLCDGGPELILGGASDRALGRMARWADGFVHQGGPPRAFRSATDRVLAAWTDAGRPGRPRLWGMGYFALGEGAAERGHAHLSHYYGFVGAFSGRIAGGLLSSPAELGEFVDGYAEAGCDELVLFPTVGELDQVDRLAAALPQHPAQT